MNDFWIPLWPMLIPFIGGGLTLFPFDRYSPLPLRRWLYVALLAGTGVSLGLAAGQSAQIDFQIPALDAPLDFHWAPLGSWAGYLLLGALVFGEIPRLRRPLSPLYAACRLALVSAAMAIFSASDFLTLCLAWSAQTLCLLLLRGLWREKVSGCPGPGLLWSSFASTACLILASLSASVQGRMAPLWIWSAAIGLRLLAWSPVGGLRRRWEIYLISLAGGFYLWLNLGPSFLVVPLWVPGAVAALLIFLGLIAMFQRTPHRALPYLVSHWLFIALVAPFIGGAQGFLVSLLVALHLAMSLLVLRLRATSREALSMAGKIAWLVAWGSLGGLPFTLGFAAHGWLLLLAMQAGKVALIPWLLFSFLFVAWPIWEYWRSPGLHLGGNKAPGKVGLLIGGVMGTLGVGLLALGVYPWLLAFLWPGGPFDFSLLHPTAWKGQEILPVGLRLAIVLVPLLPAFWPRERTKWLERYHLWRILKEWRPYWRLGRFGGAFFKIGRQGIEALVEAFPFGWVVVWGVALVYLLTGL